MYSIVTPIFNDSYLTEDFCAEVAKTFQQYLGKSRVSDEIEVLFIDDGSAQDSRETLIKTCEKFSFVKAILLSRNFGQHIALSCGYQFASGDFVIMLNADMQDPPSEIPKLLAHIEKGGCDIVYGLRDQRQDPFVNRFSSLIFNLVLNKLTRSDTPINVATLRIMNRKFVEAYNSLNESSRYIPGLENWIGFRKAYIPISHQPRKQGKSSYNLKRRLLLALNSIISFSDFPVRVTAFVGIIISLIGFLLLFFLVISKIFFINYQPGYTSTISVIVFIGGLQIFVIGIASLYIGRILAEVQNRPLYVIQEKFNFVE